MITLYTFGPGFGLPDPSAFVSKAMVLLKMAGLNYETSTTGFNKAPKGKLPYMDDDGDIIADTTFIRKHIERKYGHDFDAGLTPLQKAYAHALEKMCEEQIYWAVVHDRWMKDHNYTRGPKKFFKAVPAPLRPIVEWKVRGDIKKALHGQGYGRHSAEEIQELATESFAALAEVIGDDGYLISDEPCGADATTWSFVASALSPTFQSGIVDAVADMPRLVAYRDRGMARWFPDLANAS